MKSLWPDHPKIIDILQNYGVCLRELKKYNRAIRVLKKSLEKQRSQYGKNSLEVCYPLSALGQN